MAFTLPNLAPLTDAQGAKVMEAFNNDVTEFRKWYRKALEDEVILRLIEKRRSDRHAEELALEAQIRETLLGPT